MVSSAPTQSHWLPYAIGSGAFAAFNGVFAKLTTTSKTYDIAAGISQSLGICTTCRSRKSIEFATRAGFFGFNIMSNAIMWVLFTKALTASSSTTRVSIMNVSSNFLVTALLGFAVFEEGLPVSWWLGACLLVAGTVVIGKRERDSQSSPAVGSAKAVAMDDGKRQKDARSAYQSRESDGGRNESMNEPNKAVSEKYPAHVRRRNQEMRPLSN